MDDELTFHRAIVHPIMGSACVPDGYLAHLALRAKLEGRIYLAVVDLDWDDDLSVDYVRKPLNL